MSKDYSIYGFESEMYVVIPTHKQVYLEETLKALSLQSYKNFIVIIVENPERTNTVQELAIEYDKYFKCIHIQSPIGANNARNTGLSIIDDYDDFIIALLDDDCIPDSDWIETIKESFKDETLACVGGRVDLSCDKNLTRLQSEYLTKINWGNTIGHRPLQNKEYIASCNLAFKKSVFAKVGGFNANLGYFGKDNFIPNDEVLFIRDCANYGSVCYNDNMRIIHKIDNRVNKRFLLKRAYGQGYANILLEKEQGIHGNYHNEAIYYSKYNLEDIDLQIAKQIGMIHAIKGIKPSNHYYSLLEELVRT